MANKVVICGIDTSTLPKCTKEHSELLLKQIKQGNTAAQDEFVMYNIRLVLSIIQRFNVKSDVADDIFQVGMIGLLKSIDNFDINLGVRFSTYAVPMIIGEIRRFLRDSSAVKVSRNMRDIAYKAMQAKQELFSKNSYTPSIDDIAKQMGMPVREVACALDAIAEPVSLYEMVYGDDNDNITVMDQIKDINTEDNLLERTALMEAIYGLDERERQILLLRYYDGKTQTEISEEIGISQAQVSRLEKNAIEVIKNVI